MIEEYISLDQQRQFRYFLIDALKWIGRIFYDLMHFIFNFLKSMAQMAFSSKK